MADSSKEITQGRSEGIRSFGPFSLSLRERALFEGDRRVSLGARAFDVLLALTDRPGELISKDELLARVWPDVHVDDAALRVHISGLRKALRASPSGNQYIATVAGRGYRFIASVVEASHAVTTTGSSARAFLAGVRGAPARVIGRNTAVQTLVKNLPVRRFVTITGAGGIGKTTVALTVAARLADEYRDGVQFIDLTSLSDPALVLHQVASGLQLVGLSFGSEVDLVAAVRDRQMLLVLDNCEHLLEPVALLAERLFTTAPAVHILTTSREPLRAAGEWVQRLPPLRLPPRVTQLNSAEVLSSPSVILFVERSRAANEAFVLTDADLPSVVDICHRVDGIPLAIELAAARVDLFGVQVLARLLNESFDLLTGGRRTALPRQRTLRATLNWSYKLLSEEERVLLCRLAVFRDSFTLDAARVVAEERDDKMGLLHGMAALVDKSLISVVQGASFIRYRLLATTRAYASEKLAESSGLDEVMRRHANYFYLLIGQAEADWPAKSDQEWLASYGHTVADMRAAIDWLLGQDHNQKTQGICLTSQAAPLWFALGLIDEYRGLAERALAIMRGDREQRYPLANMQLHTWLAAATLHTLGPVSQMVASYAKALDTATKLNNPEYQLHALWGLGAYYNIHGDYEEFLETCRKFSALSDKFNHVTSRLLRDRAMSAGLSMTGQLAEARMFGERALATPSIPSRSIDKSFHEYDHHLGSRVHLSRILWLQGFPNRAALLAREGVENALSGRYSPALCFILATAAIPIALWSGHVLAAQRYMDILANQTANLHHNYWRTWREYFTAISELGVDDGSDAFKHAVKAICALISGPVHLEMAATIREELVSPVAIARTSSGRAIWCTPEILRADAVSIANTDAADALALSEEILGRSLAIACEQGALAWQLRTAMSLARLYQSQDDRSRARSVLAPVYEAFSEGFGTTDLKAAAAMLARL